MSGERIAVIGGDGIGPEVTAAAIAVSDRALASAGRPAATWQWFDWGSDHFRRHGVMMPAGALEQLAAFDAILFGAVGDPGIPDHVTLNGLILPIRRRFDQFLCVRPSFLYEGVVSPLRNARAGEIDLVVYRENTEGEYANVGGRLYTPSDHEVAIQTAVFTRRGCRRIMEAAFHGARQRRKHVTSITKSNAQGYGMVMWDEEFRATAARHPDIQTGSLLIDAAAMEFVRNPQRFDVVVASNLFGDILTDLGAIVSGSMGMAPSANINPDPSVPSMFEPVHGSAPDIAGKGTANPIAAVLSAAMMWRHVGQGDIAALMEAAVAGHLREGGPRTPDLGGAATTREVTESIAARICRRDNPRPLP